jgi:hypothetical protein
MICTLLLLSFSLLLLFLRPFFLFPVSLHPQLHPLPVFLQFSFSSDFLLPSLLLLLNLHGRRKVRKKEKEQGERRRPRNRKREAKGREEGGKRGITD